MSFASSDILTKVAQITGLKDKLTSISDHLTNVLYDLSLRLHLYILEGMASPDDILDYNQCERAVVAGVAAKVYDDYEIIDKVDIQSKLFETEIVKLNNYTPVRIAQIVDVIMSSTGPATTGIDGLVTTVLNELSRRLSLYLIEGLTLPEDLLGYAECKSAVVSGVTAEFYKQYEIIDKESVRLKLLENEIAKLNSFVPLKVSQIVDAKMGSTTEALAAATGIDHLLIETMIEISRRTCSIMTESTGTAVESVPYIAKPTDSVMIDYIVVDGIKLTRIDYSEYLEKRLTGFAEWGTKIYIRPTPASAVSYTICYRQQHPANLTTILFGDEYRPAIKALVAAKVYDQYEIYDARDKQELIYERELGKVLATTPETFICSGRPR